MIDRRSTLLLPFALAACGRSRPTVGVLRRGNWSEPSTLDPARVSLEADANIVRDCFMGLTTAGPAGETLPGAAHQWNVSSDGLRYTFKLRRDLRWSDGTPLTAEDFAYSFRRLFEPATGAPYASHLYVIKGARRVAAAEASSAAIGVRAPAPDILEIELEHPAPQFPQQVQNYLGSPVPRHVIERFGDRWSRPGTIVVNGAFIPVEWQPRAYVRLVRNPRFIGVADTRFEEIILLPNDDPVLEMSRFRAGDLDVAVNLSSDQIPAQRRRAPSSVHGAPGLNVYYFVFNLRAPPFDDHRVRLALEAALDRDLITGGMMRNGEIPAYSIVPPGTAYFHLARPVQLMPGSLEARQEMARRLLDEAGYGPARPLRFQLKFSSTGTTGRKACIAAASLWQAIGAEVELFNAEGRVHFAGLREGNFQMAWADWNSRTEDPTAFLDLLKSGTGRANYGGYANPVFDSLMERAQAISDPLLRERGLGLAEAAAARDVPVIPLFTARNFALVDPAIQGWLDNRLNVHPSRFLWRAS